MKKFLSLLMFVMFSFSLNATITNVDAEVQGTEAVVYWQADTTLSTYYSVALVDGTSYAFFCQGAWPKEAFVITGTGYLAMSTDDLLNYGMNYTDLDPVEDVEIIPVWQTGWETNVDTLETEDFTLKPGTYLFTITGYSATFTKTEDMNYTMFVIENTTEALDEIKYTKTNNKFINKDGKMYILRGKDVYDIMGHKVK